MLPNTDDHETTPACFLAYHMCFFKTHLNGNKFCSRIIQPLYKAGFRKAGRLNSFQRKQIIIISKQCSLTIPQTFSPTHSPVFNFKAAIQMQEQRRRPPSLYSPRSLQSSGSRFSHARSPSTLHSMSTRT